jgi:hypothetical protein
MQCITCSASTLAADEVCFDMNFDVFADYLVVDSLYRMTRKTCTQDLDNRIAQGQVFGPDGFRSCGGQGLFCIRSLYLRMDRWERHT